ncbi:MAG: hypothetical protein ACI4BD_05780 [Paludibacteraceae bacterium]
MRRLVIFFFAIISSEWLCYSHAQVYSTSMYHQPAAQNSTDYYGGVYDGTYTPLYGESAPKIANPFISTAAFNNQYTISVSALNMAEVGLAQEPSYNPGIFRAPPSITKDEEPDVPQPGVVSPVGDGIWVLLACVAALAAFRTRQTRRAKEKI